MSAEETPRPPAAKKAPAKEAAATKAVAKKAPAKKAVAKKAPAKKAPAKKAPAKKAPAKKAPVKKAVAKKAPAKKAAATEAVAKKAPAKKAVAKKAPTKKAVAKTAPAKKAPAKMAPAPDPAQRGPSPLDAGALAWLESWPFAAEGTKAQAPAPLSRAPETEPELQPEPQPSTQVEPQPGVPPEPDQAPRRRLPAAVLIAAVLVVAVLVVGAMIVHPGDGDGRSVSATSGQFAAPVALAPGMSYVRSTVLPSGALEVTHWIHTDRPVDSVTLRTPRTLGLDPGSVRVTNVVLAANGVQATQIISTGGAVTRPVAVPSTEDLYVSYRIAGVVQRSGDGGRALARITSLDVLTGGGPVRATRTVLGVRVLALACTNGGATATAVPCGEESDGTWSVPSASARSRVMAQVDLS